VQTAASATPTKPASVAVNTTQPGKIFRDCADCPGMIAIPDKNYALGKYEVTQTKWYAIMGNNPSHFSSCGDNCPVENVSWNNIQGYLTKLNQKTGKNCRLPKETEWEYACYGGNQTDNCGSNDINAVAWYAGNSDSKTHTVGQKQPNGYGLYDMSGNVWELMEDCYNGDCAVHVLRGGSCEFPQLARAADRTAVDTAYRSRGIGFRLARTLP
jgi:formylglycine-generating enzyme required for sulfatase activity